MTYPGRRSGSNESDRTSDVSQQSISSKQSVNKFPLPRGRILSDSHQVSVSPIAHHVASPPHNRRMGSGSASSVTSSMPKPLTRTPERLSLDSQARLRVWDKQGSRERASFDSTASEPAKHLISQPEDKDGTGEIVAHGPAKAKPFIGRANTVQLPMAKSPTKSVTSPAGKPESKGLKRKDRVQPFQQSSIEESTKPEEQQVLKDIDNTIHDMTKALKRDTLANTKAKSFETQVTPIALLPTTTTDAHHLAAPSGSTREERMFKYKQARRKELAKIANQTKSKSLELPETNKVFSEMEPHTPKFSRKYGSKESIDEKPVTTFTSIAVPAQHIVMPSPILPKSVTSPPIATVSPIMASVLSSSESSGIPSALSGPAASTTVVPSNLDSRVSASVAETTFTATTNSSATAGEVSRSAFKPVKASSPTKVIPTSVPLDRLSQSPPQPPIRVTSPVIVSGAGQRTPNKGGPSLTSVSAPTALSPLSIGTASGSQITSMARSKPEFVQTSLVTTSVNDSMTMSVLPASAATSSVTLSPPVKVTPPSFASSIATSLATTTASVTSSLASIRSASSSDVSLFAKRHVLKKQPCVESTDTISALKQFVMTPAAIARVERKLAKSKSETSMFLDHDPLQSANARAEKTFLERGRKTSKDIEKWEDLIMNVADMQQELENIEFKMKQTHKKSDSKASASDKATALLRTKAKQSDKLNTDKKPTSKQFDIKSPERADRLSPIKKADIENGNLQKFDARVTELLQQEVNDLAQIRRKLLEREDSFNRPDSPIREPMALPKESVIRRNRLPRECVSSSSSDGGGGGPSPQRSPRVSPRVHRKKKPGSGPATTGGLQVSASGSNLLSVDHAHGHKHHKEHGGRRDPNR